jgi:hypothetical protein
VTRIGSRNHRENAGPIQPVGVSENRWYAGRKSRQPGCDAARATAPQPG